MAWPQSGVGLGLAPSPLLHVTARLVTSPLRVPVQPEQAGRDASVQAAVQKLQEENRLLKQKLTHVSAGCVRGAPGSRRPCPRATLADSLFP